MPHATLWSISAEEWLAFASAMPWKFWAWVAMALVGALWNVGFQEVASWASRSPR